MTDKTLGAYKRTTPDPDETTGEALARLQAEMTRLLDEADAELRDEADGGVTAGLIEQEAEKTDPSVDYHAMWWKAEREREKAERERDEARAEAGSLSRQLHDAQQDADMSRAELEAESRPLSPDAITDEMVERARSAYWGPTYGGNVNERVRAILTAALTEPPARPEGAERWEDFLIDSLDYQALADQQIADLADRIAEEMNR